MKTKQEQTNKQTINLLQTLDAYYNCIKSNNYEWQEKWEDKIIETLKDILPHGSGIDCKWEFELHDNYILCTNSWHLMNDMGSYCGFIDFRVVIKANYRDMFGKLIFDIHGKFGKHQDIKDYLYEIIGYSLENL